MTINETIYRTRSVKHNKEVVLCKSVSPNYNFVIKINGIVKAYIEHFGDAYRLYNEYART